jgi:hypothetical protein
MKQSLNLLSRIYAAGLRLYPPGFQRQFAEEMQAVFSEALEEAGEQGWPAPARLFLREIGALPAGLLHEFQHSFDAWVRLPWNDPAYLDLETPRPASWLTAGIAGLPHLLYALALYLPLLVTEILGLTEYHGPSLPVFWGLTVAALLLARRLGWPRWSSSWVGYGLVFVLEWGSLLVPAGLLAYLGAAAWLCLAAILLFWQARRDWIGGLLAVLPVSPMWIWLSYFDGLPGSLDAAALYLSVSLLLSLAVVIIARRGRWQTALLLLLAVILATSMPVSSASPFPGGSLGHDDPTPWSGSGGWLASYLLMFFFTAPLWLVAVWRQYQRRRAT